MKSVIFSFSLLMLFIFSACNAPKNDTYTQQMDSLIKALAQTAKDFEAIDYPGFEIKKQKAKNNLFTLQALIKDTLKREDAILISNYARVPGKNKGGNPIDTLTTDAEAEKEKKAEEYGKHRQQYIKQEISLCSNQLEDLKHDYAQDLMDADALKKNLETEAANARKIMDFVMLEKSALASRLALFDSLNPGIERIIDSLKALPKK